MTETAAGATRLSPIDWILARRQLLTLILAGGMITAGWVWRWTRGAEGDGGFGLLMTAAAVVAGVPVATEAIGRLRVRQFSIALLVTIAAIGALWIGEPWEAAAVTFLFITGGWLESLTLARTRSALRRLVDLAPRTARVMRGSAIVVVAADEVQPGERVVVLPGDRVPVDGTVTAGRAALDTAALTGEPLPVEAGPGDSVLGGSVSQGGHLEIEAVRVGPDTTFSRLIYLVAEAQDQKPKVQRLLDRFARWYTPAVIASAVAILGFTRDFHLGLTFLVIACPGALVVASPVAVVAGLGNAARHGVLIKGGERLERISRIGTVAFDKTGTLTRGRPEVRSVVAFSGAAPEVVRLAAAAEQRSEHHLARAILAYAETTGVTPHPASDWRLEPGLGAAAKVSLEWGEVDVLVGNRRLLAAHGVVLSAEQEAAIARHEHEGATLAIVAAAGRAIGFMAIADPVRSGAKQAIDALRGAGVSRTVMLTGDNQAAAERVAGALGIDEVRASLLPAGKVDAIRALQVEGSVVAMVGDGINDAPALAVSDVSIAMGASGTQAAIEAADIALMGDRLEQVPYAIHLSRRIMRVVRQNVVIAVGVVLFLLVGVLMRQVHLAGGMLVHEASVLLVIFNGMRLANGGETAAAKAAAVPAEAG